MLKPFSYFLFLLLLSSRNYAQDLDHLTKDLKCFDRTAYSSLDLLISSRESGGYEPMAEWSEKVSPDDLIRKKFPMEGGFQYVIILTTEQDVDATAIEIKDSRGEKLEYEYKVSDLDRNQINFFYTPPRNDVYQIIFRTVNAKKASTCMYMAVLKGDPDSEEQ